MYSVYIYIYGIYTYICRLEIIHMYTENYRDRLSGYRYLKRSSDIGWG